MKFNSPHSSSNGLLEIIKSLGDNITGCEVGVWQAENLCQILEKCDNISKMYAIDQYKAYTDWCSEITEDVILNSKAIASNNLASIEQSSKVVFLELSSNDAAANIPDAELDFIFIDADHSYEHAYNDFCNFYSKVKHNGIFAGHDYSLTGVNKALSQFIQEKNYSSDELHLVTNDSWYLIKK